MPEQDAITRRDVLKAMGAGGLASGVFLHAPETLSQDAADADDQGFRNCGVFCEDVFEQGVFE